MIRRTPVRGNRDAVSRMHRPGISGGSITGGVRPPGSTRVKVLPFPGSLVTSILPWFRDASSWQRIRPMPLPCSPSVPGRHEANVDAKQPGHLVGGHAPAGVGHRDVLPMLPCRAEVTTTFPPRGVNLTALATRLRSTVAIMFASARATDDAVTRFSSVDPLAAAQRDCCWASDALAQLGERERRRTGHEPAGLRARPLQDRLEQLGRLAGPVVQQHAQLVDPSLLQAVEVPREHVGERKKSAEGVAQIVRDDRERTAPWRGSPPAAPPRSARAGPSIAAARG